MAGRYCEPPATPVSFPSLIAGHRPEFRYGVPRSIIREMWDRRQVSFDDAAAAPSRPC